VTIWVDADACPGAIKDILVRAAQRTGIALVLVANRPLRAPRAARARVVRVPAGFDAADRLIAAEVAAGDLVVTADIPLAARVVERGGLALDPRGTLYDGENVHERLALRDLLDQLRGEGLVTGGPAAFGAADRRAFANQLDRLLARR